jgi:hypothetical protein
MVFQGLNRGVGKMRIIFPEPDHGGFVLWPDGAIAICPRFSSD